VILNLVQDLITSVILSLTQDLDGECRFRIKSGMTMCDERFRVKPGMTVCNERFRIESGMTMRGERFRISLE
ncbi:MAG: hypothetical protein N3F66_06195, partial [Spirochaetes bacterium]|nr:hypothetical protein [Spirochaetota bacterium]